VGNQHQKASKSIKKHQKASKNIKKHQKTSKNIKKHQKTLCGQASNSRTGHQWRRSQTYQSL